MALRIRPAGHLIIAALEALAACSPSFLAEGCDQDEQPERRMDARDKWMAAHALVLDVTRLTNSSRDFVSSPGLKIETWVE